MMETMIAAVSILAVALAGTYLLIRSGRNLRLAAIQLDKDGSDIGLILQQQSAELPRLIQTCRSYMPADSPALALVLEARGAFQKASSIEEKAEAGAKTALALARLFSSAAKYDGMKTSATYVQLQNRLQEIEERIADRCDLFNQDVARFNARLARFPGRIFVGRGKLKPRAPLAAANKGEA